MDVAVGGIDAGVGVDEGSTSTLATILASGVEASTGWIPPPQATSSNMNAAGRRNDIVSLRLISLPPGCT
jgi:hypothetical protein